MTASEATDMISKCKIPTNLHMQRQMSVRTMMKTAATEAPMATITTYVEVE